MQIDETKLILTVTAVVRNQSQSGYYGLVLESGYVSGRLQIVIGSAEAQAIECVLRKVAPPRPLTHDLMAEMMIRAGVRLLNVEIVMLPGAVFAGRMQLSMGDKRFELDSRSSDAIALALRLGCPICISSRLFCELTSGTCRDSADESVRLLSMPELAAMLGNGEKPDMTPYTEETLRKMQREAAESERYELAQYIKKELLRRSNDLSAEKDNDPSLRL